MGTSAKITPVNCLRSVSVTGPIFCRLLQPKGFLWLCLCDFPVRVEKAVLTVSGYIFGKLVEAFSCVVLSREIVWLLATLPEEIQHIFLVVEIVWLPLCLQMPQSSLCLIVLRYLCCDFITHSGKYHKWNWCWQLWGQAFHMTHHFPP